MSAFPLLPESLLQSLEGVAGFDKEAFEYIHTSGNQVVSIRYNPVKNNNREHFPGSVQVPWSTNGYYLPSRPSFTLDPWLHGGVYYVQEASSMFLEQCLKQTTDLSRSLKVLDLCAAPGGKSTHIQSLITADSLLVSNEVIKTRTNSLTENLIKWGGANTIVTNNDPRDFNRLENYFDVLVVDAPCSGSGLFRKDPNAIKEWSPDAVEMCSLRQQRILTDVYASLRQNGVLIYSTCSYSEAENEDICDWLLETFSLEPIAVVPEEKWNIAVTYSRKYQVPACRFFPYHLAGEGFFIACFKKKDGSDELAAVKKNKLNRLTAKESGGLIPWIRTPASSHYYHQNDAVLAFPSLLEQELIRISTTLYVKRAGVFCGKLVHGVLIPDHELAVSNLLNPEVNSISVTKAEALQFLRKEEPSFHTTLKGWATVRFEDHPVGWVKLLANRANNNYPKEWRILKSGNS